MNHNYQKRVVVTYCPTPEAYIQEIQSLSEQQRVEWIESLKHLFLTKNVQDFYETEAGQYLFHRHREQLVEEYEKIELFVNASWPNESDFEMLVGDERWNKTLKRGSELKCAACNDHLAPPRRNFTSYQHNTKQLWLFCKDCYNIAQRVVNIINRIWNFAAICLTETPTIAEVLSLAYVVTGEWACLYSPVQIEKAILVKDSKEDEKVNARGDMLFANACEEIRQHDMEFFISDNSRYRSTLCEPVYWKLQYNGNDGRVPLSFERGLELFNMALRGHLKLVELAETKKRKCYLCNMDRACSHSFKLENDQERSIGKHCVECVIGFKDFADALRAGSLSKDNDISDQEMEKLYDKSQKALDRMKAAKCDQVGRSRPLKEEDEDDGEEEEEESESSVVEASDDDDSDSFRTPQSSEEEEEEQEEQDCEQKEEEEEEEEDDDDSSLTASEAENGKLVFSIDDEDSDIGLDLSSSHEEKEKRNNKKRKDPPTSTMTMLEEIKKIKTKATTPSPCREEIDKAIKEAAVNVTDGYLRLYISPAAKTISVRDRSDRGKTRKLNCFANPGSEFSVHRALGEYWDVLLGDPYYGAFTITPKLKYAPYLDFTLTWTQ